MNAEKRLIATVEQVRDIPFEFIGSRNVDDMLKAGKGTCTAKHLYLKKKLAEMGYECRFVVDMFNLTDFLRDLKDETAVRALKKMADKLTPYYHTYLQIKKRERWLNLDITFDAPLAEFGFCVTTNWDGESDMKLPHTPIKSHITKKSPDLLKKNLLEGESKTNKKNRHEFFEKLNELLIAYRNGYTNIV